jgi:hypothetical protein
MPGRLDAAYPTRITSYFRERPCMVSWAAQVAQGAAGGVRFNAASAPMVGGTPKNRARRIALAATRARDSPFAAISPECSRFVQYETLTTRAG